MRPCLRRAVVCSTCWPLRSRSAVVCSTCWAAEVAQRRRLLNLLAAEVAQRHRLLDLLAAEVAQRRRLLNLLAAKVAQGRGLLDLLAGLFDKLNGGDLVGEHVDAAGQPCVAFAQSANSVPSRSITAADELWIGLITLDRVDRRSGRIRRNDST